MSDTNVKRQKGEKYLGLTYECFNTSAIWDFQLSYVTRKQTGFLRWQEDKDVKKALFHPSHTKNAVGIHWLL